MTQSSQVHENNMKVVLKNSVELLEDLADDFDCALNEECQGYDECGVSSNTWSTAETVMALDLGAFSRPIVYNSLVDPPPIL